MMLRDLATEASSCSRAGTRLSAQLSSCQSRGAGSRLGNVSPGADRLAAGAGAHALRRADGNGGQARRCAVRGSRAHGRAGRLGAEDADHRPGARGGAHLNVNVRAGTIFWSPARPAAASSAPSAGPTVRRRIEQELAGEAKDIGIGARASRAEFDAEIVRIKRQGYSTVSGVPVPGINAVAAPVFDGAGALALALTLIGPTDALDLDPEAQPLPNCCPPAATSRRPAPGTKVSPWPALPMKVEVFNRLKWVSGFSMP